MCYYKEKEFENWLQNDTYRWNDKASVSSYKSGMKSLIDFINRDVSRWIKPNNGIQPKSFQEYLELINKQEVRDTFFSAVLNIIQREIDTNPSNKPTLQNYKSFLNAYEEFFRTIPFSLKQKGLPDNHLKLLRQNASNITYTQEELINEFKGRILTQDRISMTKTVMFPIRLINRLCSEKAKEWGENVCKNIYLVVKSVNDKNDEQNIKEIQIKDLKSLVIERNGKVIIEDTKGEKYVLQSSYSDPFEQLLVNNNNIVFMRKRSETLLKCSVPADGFVIDKNQNIIDANSKKVVLWHVRPLKVKILGDIAIDHDVPISLLLNEKAKQLNALYELSEKYRVLSSKWNLGVSAKYVNAFPGELKKDPSLQEEVSNLCHNCFDNDMRIIAKCKLVLMGKTENGMKSDN